MTQPAAEGVDHGRHAIDSIPAGDFPEQRAPVYALPNLPVGSRVGHIPALDGMRALAVFIVILYHFGFHAINGGLGVEIFFTLSGFLITWLLLQEVRQSGGIDFRAFYIRRTRRIFPAMYVYLLFGLALLLLRARPVPWGDVVASALYVQNYFDGAFKSGPPDTYLSHTWSLAIEEQFYLLWPLLLFALRRDPAKMARVLLMLICGVWAYRATMILGGFAGQRYLYRAFESRMDQLAIGCLLAVQLRRGAWPRLWELLTAAPWLPALTLGALALSAAFHDNELYRFAFAYGFEGVLTAVLIVQLVAFARRGPWRFFNARLPSFLGRISYSLYLYHPLVLYATQRLTEGLPVALRLAAGLGATIAFACASFYLIERRFRVVVAERA